MPEVELEVALLLDVGAGKVAITGDSSLRTMGLIDGEWAQVEEDEVDAMAIMLWSERRVEVEVEAALLSGVLVVVVVESVSINWLSRSSWIASAEEEEEEGVGAEGVVANASLSRSAVDTSLSKGASAEEAWATMSGKEESVVENMMARTEECGYRRVIYSWGWERAIRVRQQTVQSECSKSRTRSKKWSRGRR